MRGLGHTYHAIGDMLAVWGDPPALPSDYDALVWPDGWAADPAAFKAGLDLSTRELTDADRRTAWYEQAIGYVPNSIKRALKYHPEFVKVNRSSRASPAPRTISRTSKGFIPFMRRSKASSIKRV